MLNSPRVPQVSVIIPAYNAAATLPATIASVLAQTFWDFELIIINDGSTDNTAQVAESIPRPAHPRSAL
ncbi:MAG: glycosyltransferase [Synechococcales cyanobacterium RU_4_20]|nr:glycosyltransferase [Synechococcales cyanobacterium RU_4_20]